MVEVDSCTNNWRKVFLGFQLEYLNIVSQIECVTKNQKKLLVMYNISFSL